MKSIECKPFFRPESIELRYLPEGPTQLLDENSTYANVLAWVAIQHGPEATSGSLNLLSLSDQSNKTISLNGRPGFLAQAVKNNCLYLGLENRVVLFDYSREEILWDGPEILPHVRTAINDGIGTSDGLIFGTKDLQFKDKLAHLYAFDSKSGELRTLADGQTCSNGKVLMAGKSNTYLLDIDTPTKQLRRYDIDPESGDLADPQTVIDLQDRKDFPDGMRLSPDSKSVVIAFYNPADVDSGKAIQFNINSGQMEIEWILPNSPRVTCPEFVRIDGETKIVFTTADEGLSPDQQTMHSEAGSLFIGDYPSHDMPQTRPKAPLPPNL